MNFFQKFSIFLENLHYIKNKISILFVVTVQNFAPPPQRKNTGYKYVLNGIGHTTHTYKNIFDKSKGAFTLGVRDWSVESPNTMLAI